MDLFDPPIRRDSRRSAAFLPLFDDAALRDEPAAQDAVTPEERDSVLRDIGSLVGGTISRVGDALSVPGDYLRGALASKPGERLTGRDFLREIGAVGDEDNWGNFAAGMVADVVTDPLSLLSGPAKSLTAAGKAAQKLNLLDNAATVATRKAISAGTKTADLPMVAQRTKAALEKTGRTVSTFDPATVGRPIFGTRTAQRSTTLDDLITHADDPHAAEQAARQLLGDKGLAQLRNQTLSKSFGVGLPLQEPAIVGDLFGKKFGDKYADVLDTVGQGLRWSWGGRVGAAAFNHRVGGAIDAEDQITNIANLAARDRARAVAKNADVYNRARLHAAHPEVFSEDGNRIVGRLIEHGDAATPEDKAYLAARPELQNYINGWTNTASDALDYSREAGLPANELTDAYGMNYLPRQAEAALEMASRSDRKLANALSHLTGDMMGRTDAMQLPGGRDTIIDLSRDTNVSGAARTMATDEAAADYLQRKLAPMVQPGQPPLERDNLVKLARVLRELPADVVQKSPLFGQHPVESIGSYLTGRAEAGATMNTIYDSLATFVTPERYDRVAGGKMLSMDAALERLGAKSYDNGAVGAKQQMRQRLSNLMGLPEDSIRLADVSVPEEQVNRLLRARDVFSTDEASSAMLQYLDHYTQAWRGSILTWPSRAVRDLYSGAVSNWLEGAFDTEAITAAKGLLSEGANNAEFQRLLQKLPRYSGPDGAAAFYADLAGTELAGGPAAFELGGSTTGARALDPIIGASPVNVSAVLNELAPKNRSWGQFAQDFGTWRSKLRPTAETMNPVLRAGEKLNSLTDGINRISGFLALMKQGFDPAAAAKAIKRANVDYSALSGFEKGILKNIFPWYSYQSKIFREVLRQLAERPGGRYGQMIRATERAQDSNDDQYIPSGLRSQFAAPLPEMLGGKPAEGTTRYVTDLDFPGFDQINMVETPGTVGGAIAGTGRQVGMQLHPLSRTAAEIIFGTDLFNNRPLGESTSTLDAIGRAVTGNDNFDVPAVVDKAVENIPFAGRPLYLARALTDSRGGASLGSRAAKAAVNATTGIKFRDVSQEDALADATRQIETSIDPYTREFTQTYIPDHLEPYVPQWALRRQAVARALARERRDARAERTGKGKKTKGKKKRKSDTGAMTLFD